MKFAPSGNTISLTANVANVQANLAFTSTDYLVVNTGTVPAFLKFGTANTTSVTIANATSAGTGFPVAAGASTYIYFAQPLSNIARVYISGITSTSTAQVFITPGVIYQ